MENKKRKTNQLEQKRCTLAAVFSFGFLQLFRVLTRKNPNFYSLRVPDPKKPEP